MSSYLDRSVIERLFHALAFELVAVVCFTPIISWVTGKPLMDVGFLTFLISGMAVTWNLIFNFCFDLLDVRFSWVRTFWVRLAHALAFEAGLIMVVVPVMAWWLSISLVEAFVLDVGLLLMFVPYTMAFNWSYDKLRALLIPPKGRVPCEES